jgi:hypothetical protein
MFPTSLPSAVELPHYRPRSQRKSIRRCGAKAASAGDPCLPHAGKPSGRPTWALSLIHYAKPPPLRGHALSAAITARPRRRAGPSLRKQTHRATALRRPGGPPGHIVREYEADLPHLGSRPPPPLSLPALPLLAPTYTSPIPPCLDSTSTRGRWGMGGGRGRESELASIKSSSKAEDLRRG